MADPDQELEPQSAAHETAAEGTGDSPAQSGETHVEDASSASRPVFHQAVLEGRLPKRIGRFQIRKKLGKGSFGAVYLGAGENGQLAAIKIAEFKPGTRPDVVRRIQQTLQQEAEAVRDLDHPHIVRLLDFHLPDDRPDDWYLVYAYIDGGTLRDRLQSGPLDPVTAATLIMKLADALHVAHRRKLIHRDIKPANIMLDSRGEPYLADFGLAVTESEMLRRDDTAAGTPLYYSPEQADGEPHLVTYRTDIYSLGATLYEMLCGKPPFADHRNSEQLKRLILETPPRSLQLENPALPDALDHICQRALRKRQDERYRHAGEMALELREVVLALQAQSSSFGDGTASVELPPLLGLSGTSSGMSSWSVPAASLAGNSTLSGVTASVTQIAASAALSPQATVRGPVDPDAALALIEPKGLRSFDRDDADYFVHLLPGARDRFGLPLSISEWKRQIEHSQREDTFAVGLMYGPSGCGKSSLVKAGLIPRLAPSVMAVYLEATPAGTEDRIRQLVRRECPGAFEASLAVASGDAAQDQPPLNEFLKAVRSDPLLRRRRKLLIVIDQFEQWLHVNRSEMRTTELVRALRQADGENLQFLLLIREDFWVPTSRLFHELEIPLVDGVNSRLVDLFDLPHARRVLHAFGAAYRRLPALHEKLTAGQEQFLDDAVTGMSEDRRVICVRLSLFADMLREREWTPATLREVGGAAGVGVAFLEETFGSQSRHPELRTFEKPVRGVLQALLPDVGTDIKGRRRTREELQSAAELDADPRRFQRLLEILDRELRIITPVEEEGGSNDAAEGGLHYQLAHDYLVPSIRDWLTRKQRETWRGRAGLALAERTAQWLRTRDRRFLPSVAEFIAIQAAVPRLRRSTEQRQLMRAAKRWYGSLLGLCLLAVMALTAAAWEVNGRTQARRLTQQIISAVPYELPRLLDEELPGYRRWADPLLRDHVSIRESDEVSEAMRLRASLGLLDVDETQAEFLGAQLLSCTFEDFPVIRDRLGRSPKRVQRLLPELWQQLRGAQDDAETAAPLKARLRAGMALAGWDTSGAWTDADYRFLAERLTGENPVYQAVLLAALRPLRTSLLPMLESRFRDTALRETERSAAASALADYAAGDGPRLAQLLADADPAQFEILFPLAEAQRGSVLPVLMAVTSEEPAPDLPDEQRVTLGRQRAGAAVALMRLKDAPHAFRALQVRDDPEALTQFVHRQRPRGVTPFELLDALDRATAPETASSWTIRLGLLLALGEFQASEIPSARRAALIARLEDWYRHDPRSGIHSAAGWLLRQWKQTGVVEQVDRTPLAYDPTGERDWFVDVIRGEAGGQPFEEAFTFIVFPPGEFRMGSPLTERERSQDEVPHRVRLTRPVAFCDREVSVAQWQRFDAATGQTTNLATEQSPTAAHPMNSANWFGAQQYCRWLTTVSGLPDSEQCCDEPLTKEPAAGAGASEEPDSRWFHPERAGYRLPTEAEWEYASRAGTVALYGFGSDRSVMPAYANYLETSQNRTRFSGQLRPNLRGVFDMHGNILEWCYDWFGPFDVTREQIDPLGMTKSSTRVLKGGSWSSAGRDCRSADRHDYAPVFRGSRVGFRIVRTPAVTTSR